MKPVTEIMKRGQGFAPCSSYQQHCGHESSTCSYLVAMSERQMYAFKICPWDVCLHSAKEIICFNFVRCCSRHLKISTILSVSGKTIIKYWNIVGSTNQMTLNWFLCEKVVDIYICIDSVYIYMYIDIYIYCTWGICIGRYRWRQVRKCVLLNFY